MQTREALRRNSQMRDRSGETSGAGADPSANAGVGGFPGLEVRGELPMSELRKIEYDAFRKSVKENAQGGTLLTADEATAQLEKAIGARWANLSHAEKERLVEAARAEQRRLTENGGDGKGANTQIEQFNAAVDAARTNQGAVQTDPPPKRKRGRPPKEKKKDGEGWVVGGSERAADKNASANVGKKKSKLAKPGGQKAPTAVYIANGAARVSDAIDPSAILPGAQLVSLTAADGVVASPVPPGGEQLVGQQVEGIVDGEFASGYFLTVRINGCLLRGMVWDEDVQVRGGGKDGYTGQGAIHSTW